MNYKSKFSEQSDTQTLRKELVDFFVKTPHPTDDMIHALAQEKGMEPSELETEIYAFLGDFLGTGKFVKSGKKESDFDPKEIEMGLEVEKEHTTCSILAKRISMDHLSEREDYYSFGKSCGIFDELK
jgi:hypothetical protein